MKKRFSCVSRFCEKKSELLFPRLYRLKRLEEKINVLHDNLIYLISSSHPVDAVKPPCGPLRELQCRDLKLFKQFQEFLNKHSLECFVTYGTLLGAIRHGGYIPWDDDLDVGMMREDYESLLALLKNDSELFKVYIPFDGIREGKWLQLEGADGAVLDVFPYDILRFPSKKKLIARRRREKSVIRLVSLFFKDAVAEKLFCEYQRKWAALAEEHPEWIEFFLPGLDTCEIVDIHLESDFLPLKQAEFDGQLVNVPKHAKKCLRNMYGIWENYPSHIQPHHQYRLKQVMKKD